MSDTLQRFMLEGAPVRGEIVSLDHAWLEVVDRHALPPSVRDRLGELSAAALLLAASLKFDGALVLQIHGDGPVALFVVECDAQGTFRATVKLREGSAIPPDAGLRDLVDRAGGGRFVVTLDPRTSSPNRQPYQGIVPFEGESVSEVLEQYMARSEQVPTRLWLAADGRRSVGLLLQRLPEEGGAAPGSARDEDGWNRMQQLADTISTQELLGLPSAKVLERLFWQEPLRAFDRRDCRFACTCSRDKVAAMLRTLGRDEIDGILSEFGKVEVHCEFCNIAYSFDSVDCASLFVPGLSPETPDRPH
jgi:molecular chaperone Hsp33